MKKAVKIIGGIIVGIIVLSVLANTCNDKGKTTTDSTSTKKTTDSTSTEKTKPKDESGWRYSEEIDQMDNTKTTVASLDSDNSIKFDFPYGNSDFTLHIRKWKGSTDVFLTGSRCQFIAGFRGEKTYRVKFDNEEPFNVSANHSTSGTADIVFLGSTKKLISKLKNANKLIIEAEFFDVGYKQIIFSTKGLKWE